MGSSSGFTIFLALIVAYLHLKLFLPDNSFTQFCFSFGGTSGKAPVIGFLLVSGYSIAASLDKGLDGFYQRRFLRIYPLYFFALVFALILELFLSGEVHVPEHDFISYGWLANIGNFLFLQTFLVKPIAFNEVVWSLSVEVFYYLLAPFFFKLRPRYLVLLIAVSSLSFVLPKSDQFGILYFFFVKFNALQHLWPWLIGFMCFRYRSSVLLASFSALGMILVKFYPIETDHSGLTVLTFLISFFVLIFSAHVDPPKILLKPLEYLGNLSYPLYLFHIPSFILGFSLLRFNGLLPLTLLTGLITVMVYHLVDIHLKRKLFYPMFNKIWAF